MRDAELLEDAGDGWIAVLRGLPDNPLAQYLQLLRRRRAERQPRWQRFWMIWALVPVLFGLLILSYVGGWSTPLLLLIPFGWLAEGLFVAAMDCQLLLSNVREKGGYVVDDMLASSRMSNREILLAALSVFLPPLWLRLAVLLLLGWFVLYSQIGGQPYAITSYLDLVAHSRPDSGMFYEWQGYYGSSERPLSSAAMAGFELAELISLKRFPLLLNLAGYLLPPATLKLAYAFLCILFVAASSFFSSLILVLSFLCCGRGQRGRLLPIFSSVVICLAVGCYAWLSWRELNLAASLGLTQYYSPPPLILIAAVCVVLSSFVLCINLARDLPALRGGLWFILPVWGAAGFLACQLAGGGSSYGYSAVSQDIASAYLWAWGALFPLNALSIPPPLVWPLQLSYAPPPDSEWLRWPLLLGLQLLVLLASLSGALEALHFRRSYDG